MASRVGVGYRLAVVFSLIAASMALAPNARAGDSDDTVFLRNGGRVRGTVMSEDPKNGVKVKLADGSVTVVAASDVARVEYGSAATRAAPQGTPPGASSPPQPVPGAVAPPPPVPGAVAPPPQPVPGAVAPQPVPGAVAPQPVPGGTSVPGAGQGPAVASGWGHDHFAFGIGAALGVASANTDHADVGPWFGVRAALDFPLSGPFYLRVDPEIASHASSRSDYGYYPDAAGNSLSGTVDQDFTMSVLLARVMAGYDFSPMLTARAGGLLGFGSGVVKATFNGQPFCAEGSASGPAFGATVAGALRLGGDRRHELGLQGDAGIFPAPECHRETIYNSSTGTMDVLPPRYQVNNDHSGVTLSVQYIYVWW